MKPGHIIFLLALFAGFSFAATPITQCTNITTPGEYYLAANLVGANQSCLPAFPAYWESCIRISTSDVTFDCNSHSMSRGGTTKEIGVLAHGSSGERLSNITVQNCPNMYGYTFYTVEYQNVTNATIRNITAINAHSSTGFRGFGIGYGNNISIYNNTVTATGSAAAAGALVSDSSNISFTDNRFNFSTIGSFYRCSDLNISNNVWSNPTSTSIFALYMEYTNDTEIRNNSATGRCGSYCFEFNNGCNYNVIDNNSVRYGFSGYSFLITDPTVASRYNNVTNNRVRDTLGQTGFAITGKNSYVVNNSVDNTSTTGNGFYFSDTSNNAYNNTATRCGYNGFWFTGATNSNFYNSTSFNNNQNGFLLSGSSSNNHFYNSVSHDNLYSGFSVTSSSSTYITNVSSYNNAQHGFHASSSTNTRFFNASSFNNGWSGFYMSSGSSRIENSTSYNNSEHGAYFSSVSSGYYRYSTFYDNGQDGLHFYASGSNQITNNSIYSNGGDGMFFERGNSNNVQLNRVYGNNGTGIYGMGIPASLISTIYLYDNNISANSQNGIYLEYTRYANLQRNNITSNSSPLLIFNRSYGNTLQDNLFESSSVGVSLMDVPVYSTTRNSFTNNLFRNLDYAAVLWNSSRTTFTSNNRSNIAIADYLINSSNDVIINGETFNESNRSVVANSTLGSMLLNLTMVNFSMAGTNHSIFSLNDSIAPGEAYYVNWSGQPPGAPFASLHGKFVRIEALNDTPSIDTAIWHWDDSELSGYNESLLDIFKYNSSWTDMNASLDTGANKLTLSSASPLSSFGILQGGGVVNNPPQVLLNLPANGSSQTTDTWTFNFTGTDYEQTSLSCSIYLDSALNQTNASTQNGTMTSFTISNIAGGPHTWYVNCSDGTLTAVSSVRMFTVINNPPQVQLNLPSNAAVLTSSTVPFNFTATDYEQTSLSCSIYLDSALNQTNSSTQNGTLTGFTISGIANGPHTWYVNCSDGTLANSSAVRSFTMNAPVNCPTIIIPGTYVQPFDYTGAPNDASEVLPGAYACVKIASSDVVFDCDGYSITNDGTSPPTMGIVLNGSITNVTVQNCPSVSGYSFGVYSMDSGDSAISSVTAFNSSSSDFTINQSANISILSCNAAGGGISVVLPTTYSVSSVAFGYSSISGTPVVLGDDQVSGALPIGFNFTFFDTAYDQFYISSNGFITFTLPGTSGCCSGQTLPSASDPDNLVAGYWEDLNPSSGGTISYDTVGSAPNRVLVVEFNAVPHYPSNSPVYYQIKLFEASGNIEVHCQNCISDGGSHTQGIENQDGTVGYTLAGRNQASFSASNDAVRFTPVSSGSLMTYGIMVDQSQGTVLDQNLINGSEVGVLITESEGSALSSNSVFANGDGIRLFDSDGTSFSGDHLYANVRSFYAESAFTHPFDFTMSHVIFDSPGAGFTDFTNLSVTETLELDSAFFMEWSGLPAALPGNFSSFENKHLNITRYFGSPVIDELVWHWTDAESAGYTEANFVLYKYGGSWELVNASPDTAANTLSNYTLSNFSVFSILQNDTPSPSPPSEPSDDNPDKPLSVSLESGCDSNVVKVTSKGNEVSGAEIKVNGDIIGMTDSNGEIEFESDCGESLIIRASRGGYISKTLTTSTVACSVCVQEPPPEPEPEPQPEPEPECAAPSCCTTDSQCADIEYCSNRDSGSDTGSCVPVLGCGRISNHALAEAYGCSNQTGCSCPDGFICRGHLCVLRDLSGTREAFVGSNGTFHATEGNFSCALCDIRVTDPAGKVFSGKTDANGDFTLPLTLQGTYKVALLQDGEVVKELDIRALPKAPPAEPEKPTQASDELWPLWLILLLVLIVLIIIYWRRKKKKQKK
jgi:parallel beta-helix repeat protein